MTPQQKLTQKIEIEQIQSILCHPLKRVIETYGKVRVKQALCSILEIKTLTEIETNLPKYRALRRLDFGE